MVPQDVRLSGRDLVLELVDEYGLGTELVAAMHHRDVPGDVGKIERFLDRGIATADHRHVLPLVKKPVAGGAAGDAAPHEFLLGGQAQVHCGRTGGDDERIGGVRALVADHRDGRILESRRVNVVEDDLGAETLHMLLEALHQLRPLNARRVRGPIIHIGGCHQLAALSEAGNQYRFQVGARSIYSRSVAGGA